ncbi:MAG: DeoR/GlpR family DNA-binding transcription regulator [Sphaerochaeta sp.]|nr:DeoR/GlpR family DNA-binding transcription regulator [Sphaerochaeta sp.]
MHATERKRVILELLKENDSGDVITLSNHLGVSKVTIRKDLDELARKGLVMRTHGGAVLAEKHNLVRLISNTLEENTADKKAVCREALQFASTGKSIIIDSGSTTVHLASLVAKRQLTVITNSVLVINELADAESVELIIAGGQLRRPSLSAIGSLARLYFSQIHADVLFLGASAFSLEGGVSCTNLIEADTKQAMIKSASRVCLLADSSKFDNVSLAKICDWSAIDVLITNSIPPKACQELAAKGVTVLTTRS